MIHILWPGLFRPLIMPQLRKRSSLYAPRGAATSPYVSLLGVLAEEFNRRSIKRRGFWQF